MEPELIDKYTLELEQVFDINKEIFEYWIQHRMNGGGLDPLPGFFQKPKTNTVMILGSNPSYNTKGYKKELSKSEDLEINSYQDVNKLNSFMINQENYKLTNDEEFKKIITKVNKLDECIWDGKHRYAEALKTYIIDPLEIAEDFVLWDMFFYRVTKQSELKAFLKNNHDSVRYQIGITLKVIALCKPKILVIANATAASHFVNLLGEDVIKFNDITGTHRFVYQGIDCPLFLSANLHSLGQLDKYSRKRYQWHIKQVWENLK